MEKIILVTPSKIYEKQAKDFIKEFVDNNSQINGTGGLDSHLDDYDDWIRLINNYSKGIGLKDGHVKASTYFAIRENDKRIVGMVNIRHQLNDYLLKHGGNIGYGVRPTERRKGYAKEILRLGLNKCKSFGLDRALITCDKTNIGSAKTIKSNFGVLENEIKEENCIVQRYWINV